MNDIAIKVENLSKMYRIGEKQERYYTFGDTLTNIALAPFRRLRRMGKAPKPEEIIWALKDVSFEVKHGEVVGIIGRNGAGKTTLLKILSRITEPTEGQADIHGRIGSLLEVGTGFHPELTGRENIFLNGAILGMKKTEINRKFDEIVDFAEIEKFMDTPVKRYSSGMYVRLAFAVAAHLEPEILLVDEVLAVGDIGFQQKCLGKMENIAGGGRTVLFVSHNMGSIQQLCSRAILLDSGKVALVDSAYECVEAYKSRFREEFGSDLSVRNDRVGNGCIVFEQVSVIDADTQKRGIVEAGNTAVFEFKIRVVSRLNPTEDLVVRFSLVDAQSYCIAHCSNLITGEKLTASGDEFVVSCTIDRLPLNRGYYSFSAYVGTINKPFDYLVDIASFQVIPGNFYATERLPEVGHSSALLDYTWSQN